MSVLLSELRGLYKMTFYINQMGCTIIKKTKGGVHMSTTDMQSESIKAAQAVVKNCKPKKLKRYLSQITHYQLDAQKNKIAKQKMLEILLQLSMETQVPFPFLPELQKEEPNKEIKNGYYVFLMHLTDVYAKK